MLDKIASDTPIYEAWSDEPWVVDGAAVRVSLVCFSNDLHALHDKHLDGKPVSQIFSDLTASSAAAPNADLTKAAQLNQNSNVAFIGIQKTGPFDVPGKLARQWLLLPRNPNGRPNSDVLRPHLNGIDVTRRSRDVWIIDFSNVPNESVAALYEAPFKYVASTVKPERAKNKEATARAQWWLFWRPRPELRAAIKNLTRVIGTPEVAKHRLFLWLSKLESFDKNLIIVARDDDTTFGILHSRFHEAWALRLGTSLEDRPRYTPSTTFETFPFPQGLTPNIPAKDYANDPRAVAIAAAAKRLDELRRNWLNPPDLIKIEPEVVAGYPDRILPRSPAAEAELKKRTLTNLYNERPAWLDNAHRDLDAAVAAAYGWPADISEDDALARLLELNRARASKQAAIKVATAEKSPPKAVHSKSKKPKPQKQSARASRSLNSGRRTPA